MSQAHWKTSFFSIIVFIFGNYGWCLLDWDSLLRTDQFHLLFFYFLFSHVLSIQSFLICFILLQLFVGSWSIFLNLHRFSLSCHSLCIFFLCFLNTFTLAISTSTIVAELVATSTGHVSTAICSLHPVVTMRTLLKLLSFYKL